MNINPTNMNGVGADYSLLQVNAGAQEKISEIAKEVASLISEQSLVVSGVKNDANPVGTKEDIPELDEAEELASFKDDLEALIALLTLDNEEVQAEEIQKRIKSLVDKIKKKCEAVMAKINEAIDKAVQQAKEQKRNRILGWIMAVVSVIAAVVTCVATFGAAAPASAAMIVCAIGCVAGAVLSVGQLILDETGGMEKLAEYFAKKYMEDDPSLTEDEAKAKFNKIWGITMLCIQGAIAVTSLCAGFYNLIHAAKATAEVASKGLKIMQLSVSLLGVAGGAISTGFNWKSLFTNKEAAELQAELNLLQKFLDIIKEKLEQEQTALQTILQQIQGVLGDMISLMSSEAEVENSIIENSVLA